MPYFSIDTNQEMEETSVQEMLKKTSAMIAGLLGKPEMYVMVSIKPGNPMTFAGTNDPTAFVSLKSIGLAADRCPALSEKICGFVEKEFGVAKDRTFIDFKNLDGKMFGWNGGTF